MLWQRARFALLAGVCLAGTTVPVRADDAPAAPIDGIASVPAPAACKVQVTEWVPEPYKCLRTCYRMEEREETYTAFRCVSIPEPRQVTRTTYRMVHEVRDVVRCYTVCVPCVEERIVMKPHWVRKPVVKTVRKCVDRGHYECREVPARPTLCERIKKLCGKDCSDECPRTEIKKVWVPCPTWVESQVTKMERVCEYRPEVCRVTTYKKELRQEVCKVNVCKCIPECRIETVTVMVQKQVPYEATRKVCVRVPYQEEVTLTRLVPRLVEREVPAGSLTHMAAGAPCGPVMDCGNPCACPKARRCCR
jgi:hypothetical protein